MKKAFMFILILSVCLGGCSDKKESTSQLPQKSEPVVTHNPEEYRRNFNVVEEFYIEMLNDIMANPSSYIDHTINIEGMYKSEDGKSFVYRNGPECCFPDGVVCGLEFENSESFSENDWISVSGKLSFYNEDETIRLYLKECTITKPTNRGLETLVHTEHAKETEQ